MKEVQSWVCMSAWESHRPFYVPDAFLAMLLGLDSKPVSDTFGSLREIRVCVWHAYRMAAGLLTQCTAAECLLCSRDRYHSNEHEIQPLTNSQQLQKVIWSCHLEDVENTAEGTITTHKSLAAAEQCHNSGTKRRGKALPRPGTPWNTLEPTSGPFAGLCWVFWWPVSGPPVGRPGKVCRYGCDPEKLASVAPAEADCFSWVVPRPGPACPAVSWCGRKGSMPRPAASVVCVGIRVDAGVNHRGKGTPVTRGSGPLLYQTENCGVQRVRAEPMSSPENKTWH